MVSTQQATETTPLLPPDIPNATGEGRFSPVRRLQLVSYLMVAAMSMPNTSLLYVMRTMSCDAYYADRPVEGKGDRCHTPDVESLAAANTAAMSTVQTIGGIMSIFVTQFWIARFGTKAAMFQGSIWSSIRMLVHMYAMYIGGAAGVHITIVTQLLCILGSPGGFMLATNSALMESVLPAQRTAMFGMLGGAQMAGYGTGLVLGGTLYTYLGLYGPFATAFVMLVLVVLLGLCIIPYNPPAQKPAGADGQPAAKRSVLNALKMFYPMRDAHGRRSWTLLCLIFGVFMASLATGYVPIALQLVGQDLFGFEPNMTSAMLLGNMVMRTVFLMFIFPRLIAAGRRWLAHKLPAEPPGAGNASPHSLSEAEGDEDPSPQERSNAAFDIHFLRLSILVDAVLTGAVSFVRKDWQLFVAAAILPLASGTGPAAKGVVTELVGTEHKQEALSAIALVESMATVTTVGLFGSAYAALAKQGLPQMVFAANAAVAFIAFNILVPVRLRPAWQ